MHDIVLLGINHKTAPVELRECIAFSGDESTTALQSLRRQPNINEVLLFSTCNRVELLFVTDDKSRTISAAKDFIAEFNKIPLEQFNEALYIHTGDEAVRHVFRVAASLDSMVVGEPQILGQIKDAYRVATQVKTSGVVLNRLLHRTFFVAKRTFENGVELAKKFNGQAVRFEEIVNCLEFIDIIISSTGSPDFVITRDQVKGVIRKRRNRPVFFIDIAVPRDIDPQINRLSNSYVYDIDDLQGVIDDNIEDRQKEALKGERIIDEAVISFRQWRESLEVVPTIVALRNKMESIAAAEIKKTLQSNKIPESSVAAIHKMTGALINKMLHDPTIFLKKDDMAGGKSLYIYAVRKLFKLDE